MDGNWSNRGRLFRSYGQGLDGGSYYPEHSWRRRPLKLRASLRELLARLENYDRQRLELERHGGRLERLSAINRLLKEPLGIQVRGQTREVRLTDQQDLHAALLSLDQDLHLQVRLKSTHMPVYYLCRTKTDYWNEYSLVVEDYHQSPGYPLADQRFVRLMRAGHEKDFLRLSSLRAGAAGLLATGRRVANAWEVDDKLHLAGRHVFQAAWHRDQQVGMAVSQHLQIPVLGQAVELLYLCLSGELCEMRGACSPFLKRLFQEVYPQPAIKKLLTLLPRLSGEALTNLPARALSQYAALSRGFSRFLAQEVPHGNQSGPIPLWKLIYANLDRLDAVSPLLLENRSLGQRLKELEASAKEVMANLLSRGK